MIGDRDPKQLITTGERCHRDLQKLVVTGNVIIETHNSCLYWERCDRDPQQLIATGTVVIEIHKS